MPTKRSKVLLYLIYFPYVPCFAGTFYHTQTIANLAPRFSLLRLPCSLGERSWLQLLTWPHGIWVVKKKMLGWRGRSVFLFIALRNFVGFKTSSSSLKQVALSRFEVEFCRWKMLHYFCRFQNIEFFRSQQNIRQPNGALTFWPLA